MVLTSYWTICGAAYTAIVTTIPEMLRGSSNWRNFFAVMVGPSALSFLLSFLFVPETFFLRPAVAFDGRVLVQSGSEKVQIYDDWEDLPSGTALPDFAEWRSPLSWFKLLSIRRPVGASWEAMIKCYPQILLCLCNPLLFWVAVLNTLSCGGMMSMRKTYVDTLGAPPYSFSDSYIALTHLSAIIGIALAWPLIIWVIPAISRHIKGQKTLKRDSEHYLVCFLIISVISAISMILYGAATEFKWHFSLIHFAFGLNNMGFCGQGIIITLWVTEAFPMWTAPALVVVSGISYMASFGMSYATYLWIASQGFALMHLEIGLALLFTGWVAIPLAFNGKPLRQKLRGKWGEYGGGALRPQ
jgi:hypothetical protein